MLSSLTIQLCQESICKGQLSLSLFLKFHTSSNVNTYSLIFSCKCLNDEELTGNSFGIKNRKKSLSSLKNQAEARYNKIMKIPEQNQIIGDSPVSRGIPLTDAIRYKAIFHTSFSSRSSFFQSMCMIYCVNRKCYYLSKLSCFLHKFIGFIKIMLFPQFARFQDLTLSLTRHC